MIIDEVLRLALGIFPVFATVVLMLAEHREPRLLASDEDCREPLPRAVAVTRRGR